MKDSGRILVIDDEENVRDVLRRVLTKEGYEVVTAEHGKAGLGCLNEGAFDLTLVDMKMPVMDGMGFLKRVTQNGMKHIVIMMSAYGEVDDVVKAVKMGAYYYISKPFEIEEVLLIIRKALEERKLKEENERLKRELCMAFSTESIIGRSRQIKEIFDLIQKVKDYNVAILVAGESGTGKELVARALHFEGVRKDGPFVPVNCAALPETLIETELYGYKKGAFTDARMDKKGLIEEADGGTLFLDEISELPGPVQAKLLRFLQEGEIRRVGDTENRVVNTRVVSATSKTLEDEVKRGNFREDLYFRLNKVQIWIPPLRERREDIPILIEHFIKIFMEKADKTLRGLSGDAQKALMNYHWPGNVRELENLIERAVIMTETDMIKVEDLGELARRPGEISSEWTTGFHPDQVNLKEAIKIIERDMIGKALDRCGGNRPRAAKILGISHPAILYKIKEYGIN